jgi:glycerol-3-phosphate dehydrogenase
MASEAIDQIKVGRGAENAPLQDEFWPGKNPSRLEKVFGRYAEDIIELDRLEGLQQKSLSSAPEFLEAEVLYSIRYEMALSPMDFIRRRSSLYYQNPTIAVAKDVSEIFARELKWDETTCANRYDEVLKQYSWDRENY